ncbi:S8 family serine peptidase [Streptomyces celluloflavus]|uniref:S8 family serine peptidase n=1 Tax=Streptomyces celluloflavus TaxID=58344 RepID=UPI0036DCF1DC
MPNDVTPQRVRPLPVVRQVFPVIVALVVCTLLAAGCTPSSPPSPSPGKVKKAGLNSHRRVKGFVITYKLGTAMAAGDVSAAQTALPRVEGGAQLSVTRPMPPQGMYVQVNSPSLGRAALERVMNDIARDKRVQVVEPVFDRPASRTPGALPTDYPNDPEYKKEQWNLTNKDVGIRVRGAWEQGALGRGVTIAVIDSGYAKHTDLPDEEKEGTPRKVLKGITIITGKDRASDGSIEDKGTTGDGAQDPGDWAHEDLCGQGFPKKDRDSSWHGTNVMGIAAASTNNGKWVAGTAPEATILPIRISGPCEWKDEDLLEALFWLRGTQIKGLTDIEERPKVVNISLGGQKKCPPSIKNAFDSLHDEGITVIIGAGNGFEGKAQEVKDRYPANCSENPIIVGASDEKGNYWELSSYGTGLDVLAPGVDVYSLSNTGKTKANKENGAKETGTSFAAPHVAGIAALLYSKYPNLTPSQVKEVIKTGARKPLQGNCRSAPAHCGSGVVDANKALKGAGEILGGRRREATKK